MNIFVKKFLEYLKFIFYGIIQGFTEFIPVSSTAHLKIISLFFGINEPGSSLSAIIQIGSVFAIIWYFRNNISIFQKNINSIKIYKYLLSNKLFKSLFIGTIPLAFIGLILRVFVPESFYLFLRSNTSIAISSLLMSAIMFFADRSHKNKYNLKNHKYLHTFFIGIAQSLAIIPGVSRSGATISIAMLSGWERKEAARYSFLLGIPAITLVALVEFINSVNSLKSFPFFPLLVGLLTTFLSSLISINLLVRYISYKGLKLFILYRFIFGILILFNI